MSCRSLDFVFIFFYIQHFCFLSFSNRAVTCRSADFVFIFSIFQHFSFLSFLNRAVTCRSADFVVIQTRLSDKSFKPQRRGRNGRWSARATRNKESNQRRKSARALKYTPDISVVLAKFSYYLENTEVLYTNRITEILGL